MKLEDLLMQPGEEKQTRQQKLEDEVEKLQEVLNEELQVKRVLQCAMQGPVGCCESCSSLSPFLPLKVQVLLAELALVEEEIDCMETKINELKLDVYKEKKKRIKPKKEILPLKGLQTQWEQRHLKKLPSRRPNQIEYDDSKTLSTSQKNEQERYRGSRQRRASVGSSMELYNTTFQETYGIEEETENPRCAKPRMIDNQLYIENETADPSKLSIELIKCLMGIFLDLNKATFKNKGPTNLSKHALNCMNSKGLPCKGTFGCKTPIFSSSHNASHLDPYGILSEPDVTIRDVGAYKNFIQITRSSLDSSRLPACLPAMRRLKILMQKLSRVNITYFNHKQKLAFWINVYNACVMHAFLQHGLPSTQEKLLALMNEAAINVGGTVLHAFTIEHFILRHPPQKNELIYEKEMPLRHTCGLGYPEPNVTFALCRGSWSSPAVSDVIQQHILFHQLFSCNLQNQFWDLQLQFYTPDDVMNELEKAKVEYLEASVGITSKKKISVPKLMEWNMKDFADDMESLLEWIYSQLPYKSSLKRLMLECLNGEKQFPSHKLIDIQPYDSAFRYLIPL